MDTKMLKIYELTLMTATAVEAVHQVTAEARLVQSALSESELQVYIDFMKSIKYITNQFMMSGTMKEAQDKLRALTPSLFDS